MKSEVNMRSENLQQLFAVDGIYILYINVVKYVFHFAVLARQQSLFAGGNGIDNKTNHYTKAEYQSINKRAVRVRGRLFSERVWRKFFSVVGHA